MRYALFFHRPYGEPARPVVRTLRAYVARSEVQDTTEGRGWSPGRPKVASPADGHNSTGSAVVSISVSQTVKEYDTTCFPAICIEVPPFCETTTNIELTTVRGVGTIWCKTCKRCSFWLNKPRWGRGVDCFCYCCICYARIACEILVPKLVAMCATPIIFIYTIEREWILNSCACSLSSTNSLPRILVIIIGLMFFVFDY